MPDRYYIWEDDERSGPYSERELGRMLEDGIVSFAHECEHASSGEVVPLDELFEPLDGDGEDAGWEEGDGGADDGEWDESEEWEEESEEWEEWDEEADGPPPGAVLYSGHPTFLRYAGGFALVVLGVAFGLWLGPRGIWFFIGGFGVAVLTLILIVVDRSTRLYTVTPRRVEVDWGLLARSSQEVRIEDIRTINVRKSGFAGVLGVGTVEFSSTGDGVDVAFTDIWGAKKVKLLVRELQDAMG